MTIITTIFQHTEQLEFVTYAAFGLLIACVPFLMKIFVPAAGSDSGDLRYNNRGVFFDKYGHYFSVPLAVIIFLGLIGYFSNDVRLISVTGIADRQVYLEWIVITLFIVCMWFFGFSKRGDVRKESKMIQSFIVLLFVSFAVAINLSTSFFEPDDVSIVWLLHHWGAFMSASKSLNAGLAIFRDFPTQYGLGPTIVISAMSQMFGWVSGMFYAIGLMQFLYWASISAIAIKLLSNIEGRKNILLIFALLISTVSCFFWVFDADVYSNQAPSLGGARYLPAAFILALLIWLNLKTNNFDKSKVFLMHSVWCLCALWSIESLFYACFIWWPYFIYIRLSSRADMQSKIHNVFLSVVELLSVAVILLLVFLVIYWMVYSDFPEVSVYIIFVQNIPGPLLIALTGPFFFILSVFIISFASLIYMYCRHGESDEFHYLFVVILLAYAAFSYYIGRSHDYNIRPLMPFFSLILLSMCSRRFPDVIRYFSITLLSLIISWPVVSQYNSGFGKFYLFDFNGEKLSSMFIASREDPVTSDLGRAIFYINEKYSEPVIAVDSIPTVTISGNQRQWNSYNNMASYIYLPNIMQKKFIDRSKSKLMMTGWVLVHKDKGIFGESFVHDLFDNSYNLKETVRFGDYNALRFVPKAN